MSNHVIIRPYEERDLKEVARLFDAYRQFYHQAGNLALAENYIHARMKNEQSDILVAENPQSKLDGFCQLYPTFCSVEAQPIYVLYDLFVDSSARGQGIAKELLMATQQLARFNGKARIDLSTAKTNVNAQALYASLGWVRDEEFYTYNLPIHD